MNSSKGPFWLDIHGDGHQRGEIHGEALRESIDEALDRWLSSIAERTKSNPREYVRDFLARTSYVSTVAERTPDLYAEVLGIARGSTQEPEHLLAYNFMDEEWRFRSESVDSCSVLATEHTEDGVVLLGQNMDLPAAMDGSQVALRIAAYEDDPAQIVLTGAGLIGLLGANRSGLACCVNNLGQLPWSPRGLPVAFVIREVLRTQNVQSAAAFLRSVPHAVGQHYAVADSSGARGLECSARGVVPGPETSLLVHTNHSLWDPVYADTRLPRERDSSGSRTRLRALQDAANQVVTATDLEELFSYNTELCVVPGPPLYSATFCSAVFRLESTPVVRASLGRPDRTLWHTIEWGEP